MNEVEKLILKCLSILLSDPEGDNGSVRISLMKEITELTNPTNQRTESCNMKEYSIENDFGRDYKKDALQGEDVQNE